MRVLTLGQKRRDSQVSKGRWWLSVLGVLLLPGASEAGLPEPWRFEAALPQGNDLLAVWSPGGETFYAGGHGGLILHWNGTTWQSHATPTQKTIFSLHGRSPQDVWAVGGDPYTDNPTNRCLILHFDGSTWKEMAAPRFADTTYPFNAVHAVAANDVWATQDGGTFLAHYDGHGWDWVSVPLAVEGSFKAVTSLGPDHLYVAGTHGQILHRDHGVWKLEQKLQSGGFSTSILSALWAHSPEQVFAAGNWSQFFRRQPDGTWEALAIDASQPFGFGFLSVWGTSPTDVYLMDVQGMFHFDGVNPARRTSFEQAMRRQWLAGCGAGDRLFGVGPAGVAHEVTVGGGVGAMSPLTVGGHAELQLALRGAAACGKDGVLVHGSTYAQPNAAPLWLLKRGAVWRWPTLPPGLDANGGIQAVIASGLEDVIVAWENLFAPQRGVHRWDGTGWTAMAGAEGTVAFSRSPGGRLHALGPMRVQFWNGTDAWTDLYVVPFEQADTVLNALWVRADHDVYVGARNGKLFHFDGSNWKAETTPAAHTIVGIAGDTTDTYAVGENGAAWRRSGTTWQQLAGVTPKPDEHFTALAVGAEGVYAAQRTPSMYIGGGLGRVWRFHGNTATLVIQGLSQPLEALVRTGTGALVGVAPRDFILTTAPAEGSPTLERLDLRRTDWQPVGETGVSLRSSEALTTRPMVAVQRVKEPVPFAPADFSPAGYGEHWWVLEDRFNTRSAVPPLLLRVSYDPDRVDPDLAGGLLSLFQAADSLIETPSLFDPVAHTVTTHVPVDFGAWTLGATSVPPTLTLTPAAGGKLTLAWPQSATGFRLFSAPGLGKPTAWSPVDAPAVPQGGSLNVTVDATAHQRFYRLAR